MGQENDISDLLRDWPYDPDNNTRIVQARDGRSVLQVRQPLGLEQYELDGRPDGDQPMGFSDACALVTQRMSVYQSARGSMEGFQVSPEEFLMLRSEATLYYLRYSILFVMGDFERVIRDTTHNLLICDIAERHVAAREDRDSILQYKPYILRVNSLARATVRIQKQDGSTARRILSEAIDNLRAMPDIHSSVFQFERVRSIGILNSTMQQLSDLPDDPNRALRERLELAVAREDYEEAARLRDVLNQHLP